MKKKLLLAVMVVFSATSVLAHDFEVDGIYYRINNDSTTVKVTYKGTNSSASKIYSGDIVIPDEVTYDNKTYTVTEIGGEAFEDCANLTSVELPSTVKSIGRYAFLRCEALRKVNIPDAVTFIGTSAFGRCLSLTEIYIPSSVTLMEGNVFSWCHGLQRIVVDNNNSVYDSRDNCNAIILTSKNEMRTACVNTVMPNSVERFGEHLFNGFSWMTEIDFPESLVYIGQYAFNNCKGLTKVVIPNTVTVIDDCAFSSCTGLTDIVIPPSVKTINALAFMDCTGLTSINIPASVTSIGANIILRCRNISKITVDPANEVYDSRDNSNVIIETATGNLIAGCNYSTIPENVYSIDRMAFEECSKISHIELPGTMQKILDNAFKGCSSLTEIHFPSSLISIGLEAFRDCTGLKEIVLNEGLKYIDEYAFFNCSSAESITLPSSIAWPMGERCFYNCDNLKDVTCLGINPPKMESYNCFMPKTYQSATLHVPEEAIDTYKTTNYWKYFNTIKAIDTFVSGDMNGDGEVNVTDVALLVDYILGSGNNSFDAAHADVNGDGSITITDVTQLINIIIEGGGGGN